MFTHELESPEYWKSFADKCETRYHIGVYVAREMISIKDDDSLIDFQHFTGAGNE